MQLELSPPHPECAGLCRGHGGSVCLVWLIGYVGAHGFIPPIHTGTGMNGGVNSIRGRAHPSSPAPQMSQGCPWASCKPLGDVCQHFSHLYSQCFTKLLPWEEDVFVVLLVTVG